MGQILIYTLFNIYSFHAVLIENGAEILKLDEPVELNVRTVSCGRVHFAEAFRFTYMVLGPEKSHAQHIA
jgi:hypothetical protein